VATPGAGSVTSTSTSITIDWANFTTPSGVTGYLVYRGQAAAHTSIYGASPVGTPSSSVFTDNGLLPGTWYVYRIYAVNNGKISAPSGEIWKQTAVSFARMSSGGNGGGSSSNLVTSDLAMINAPTTSTKSDAKTSTGSRSVASKPTSSAMSNALSQVTQELKAKLPDSLVSLLATTKKEKRNNSSDIFGELGSGSQFSLKSFE
jgi:hypothetical protein